MHPIRDVEQLARQQHGVVTRPQVLASGLTPTHLQSLVRSGRWTALHRGVFLVRGGPPSQRAIAQAAVLAAGEAAVLSGLEAARLHGLPVLEPPARPEVILPPRSGPRNRRSLQVHHETLAAEEVVVIDGIRACSVLRTLADVARKHGHREAVVACDAALRLGLVTADGLEAPGLHRALLRAGAAADGRSESPLETLVRLVLHEAGLCDFEPQVLITDADGHAVARVDLYCRRARLAVEADGSGPHDAPVAVYRDRARQNALQRLGVRVLRFTWSDVTRRPAYVVETVRAALRDAA